MVDDTIDSSTEKTENRLRRKARLLNFGSYVIISFVVLITGLGVQIFLDADEFNRLLDTQSISDVSVDFSTKTAELAERESLLSETRRRVSDFGNINQALIQQIEGLGSEIRSLQSTITQFQQSATGISNNINAVSETIGTSQPAPNDRVDDALAELMNHRNLMLFGVRGTRDSSGRVVLYLSLQDYTEMRSRILEQLSPIMNPTVSLDTESLEQFQDFQRRLPDDISAINQEILAVDRDTLSISDEHQLTINSMQEALLRIERQTMLQREATNSIASGASDFLDILDSEIDSQTTWARFARETTTRVSIVVLLIFLVQIFVNLYRYSSRLADFCEARANSLELLRSMGTGAEADSLRSLILSLSPDNIDFGKQIRSPTDSVSELLKSVLASDLARRSTGTPG